MGRANSVAWDGCRLLTLLFLRHQPVLAHRDGRTADDSTPSLEVCTRASHRPGSAHLK
jgi:hypothetical protein